MLLRSYVLISLQLQSIRDISNLCILGTAPSNEQPYGQYPLVVNPTARPQKNVLVVQAYTFGKYLGNLKVTFDSRGEIIHYTGNPILLSGSLKQDEEILGEVTKRRGRVSEYSKVLI